MLNNTITLSAADLEIVENLISYYNCHGVENIQEKHPSFVVQDFQDLLKIVEAIITEE